VHDAPEDAGLDRALTRREPPWPRSRQIKTRRHSPWVERTVPMFEITGASRSGMLLSALLVGLAMTACSNDGAKLASPDEAPGKVPRVLAQERGQGSAEAVVGGVLGLNAKGCVTLDQRLLLAPPGTTVVENP